MFYITHFQVHSSVYVEISCPNIPQLDNLQVHIPEFKDLKFDQFNLKKAVKKVSEKYLYL